MFSRIAITIRILISALLLGNPNPNVTSAAASNDSQLSASKQSIAIESQFEVETGTVYEAVLKDEGTSKELGRVAFSYNKHDQSGYIARLHVPRELRKQSYGSALLKFTLQKLTNLNCTRISWQAYPFDLYGNQTSTDMLPKLIAFYKRHGAQVLSQTESSAQMAYYPEISSPVAAA